MNTCDASDLSPDAPHAICMDVIPDRCGMFASARVLAHFDEYVISSCPKSRFPNDPALCKFYNFKSGIQIDPGFYFL